MFGRKSLKKWRAGAAGKELRKYPLRGPVSFCKAQWLGKSALPELINIAFLLKLIF
jgi:hypothetical protein